MVQTSGNAAGCVSQPVTAACLAALRAFVQTLLPQGTAVIRANQNRIATPLGLFALLTPLSRQPLGTPAQSSTANAHILTVPEDYSVQLSLFGPGAAEATHCIATLFKTEWACQFFNNWALQNTTMPESAVTSAQTTVPAQQTPTPPTVSALGSVAYTAQTPARIAPLYATPPRQTAFITGENQFEDHWFSELHCQINTSYTLPQTTATTAYLTLGTPTFTLQDTPA